MGQIRITWKCHNGKCKKPIDEAMARFINWAWYYCCRKCAVEAGAIIEKNKGK